MHLFGTTTSEQVLQLGKMAAVTSVAPPRSLEPVAAGS
jgi:hypothetical protein